MLRLVLRYKSEWERTDYVQTETSSGLAKGKYYVQTETSRGLSKGKDYVQTETSGGLVKEKDDVQTETSGGLAKGKDDIQTETSGGLVKRKDDVQTETSGGLAKGKDKDRTSICDIPEILEKAADIAVKCIKSVSQEGEEKSLSSDEIVKDLTRICKDESVTKWNESVTKWDTADNGRCDISLVNNAIKDDKWGAILVAGYDEKDGPVWWKKKDTLKNIITSKVVPAMCIR
ncbi:hypothetical protein DPMN_089416 [Dreissena polymorpha]|uniref:Uncharacterized protein n=1 Tax=Dreissena polymorpha TaxID=45954 RepID=A0A9D4KVX1_DREPO|nr:hypothetical protein DPMN_089416 [Dreissena polymorpha]